MLTTEESEIEHCLADGKIRHLHTKNASQEKRRKQKITKQLIRLRS